MSLWLTFPLLFAASLFLFHPSLNYYFFQDDWFVLNWVGDSDWLSLLNFREDIIYWRPISMPLFFKSLNTVFNQSPLPFHLVAFAIHLLNSVLIFLLFRQLKFTPKISLLISFLYATSAFHFIPLSWLSTTSYIIGPTFIFSSLILFLKNKLTTSLILFLLALASSELALTVLPIAIVIKGVEKSNFKKLIPFATIAIFYLVVRFFFLPLPQEGEYELGLAPKILTNLFWYFLWTFNMPEAFSTVFYFSDLRISLLAILDFWQYAILPTVLLGFFIFLITKVARATLARGFLIFLVGLAPVIFLPFHVYPMYLVVSSLGIFYIAANYFQKLKKKAVLLFTFCAVWFISSYLAITFTRTNHWLVNLQSISKSFIFYTENLVADPPPASVFIFRFPDIKFSQAQDFVIVQDEQNIAQALNNQDAMQVIYRDKSLVSLYQTKDHIPQPPAGTVSFTIFPR